MLPVNEIFQTMQSEAAFTGTPAIFIRLQGCPVGCSWCDTKHTWKVDTQSIRPVADIIAKETDSYLFAEMTCSEILEEVQRYEARHIVITGGEPCLYDLTDLTSTLIDSDYSVQIETSGTHKVKAHAGTWVTVSPKIGMDVPVIHQPLAMASEIKMPIGKPADVDNLQNQVIPYLSKSCKIWLQPLSANKKATQLCIDSATKMGWKVSIQIHKFIGLR